MKYMIANASKSEYLILIDIWERSVKSSHDFLSEEDIAEIKDQILNQYFDVLDLHCIKDKNQNILGFSGVAQDKLEMLFIDPDAQGMGIGSMLCRHVIDNYGVCYVDVNEQNPKALEFYIKMGFKKIGRSALDPAGRPFPILHMSYIV